MVTYIYYYVTCNYRFWLLSQICISFISFNCFNSLAKNKILHRIDMMKLEKSCIFLNLVKLLWVSLSLIWCWLWAWSKGHLFGWGMSLVLSTIWNLHHEEVSDFVSGLFSITWYFHMLIHLCISGLKSILFWWIVFLMS